MTILGKVSPMFCPGLQYPKQKHFPPVLVTIFNISGGNENAIFVMGATFLGSALNRGSQPPEILKMATNTGGNASV